jgi:hypothetical protein
MNLLLGSKISIQNQISMGIETLILEIKFQITETETDFRIGASVDTFDNTLGRRYDTLKRGLNS